MYDLHTPFPPPNSSNNITQNASKRGFFANRPAGGRRSLPNGRKGIRASDTRLSSRGPHSGRWCATGAPHPGTGVPWRGSYAAYRPRPLRTAALRGCPFRGQRRAYKSVQRGGYSGGTPSYTLLKYVTAEADRQSNIGFLPTGLRPWGLGFLCPPTPGAPVDSLQSATGSDSIAYQGAYLSYIYRPPCNRGVRGGGAPHENGKSKIRKADAIKTGNQSVQGVQGRFHLFLHFLLSDFLQKM